MPRWTEEQQQAITLENTNILVSAGAGSGKTAVLSERALRKVKEGINIDQILILTFTKAAAYEMLLRIRSKLEENGYKEQLYRIDNAYITTFDSFALSIVKKYHERLNLKKEVSIIDENVISLKKKETLDQIFDEYYQEKNATFLKMITDFSIRDDKELKQYILNINEKLDLRYDKINFLENYINEFYNREHIQNKINEYNTILQNIITKIKENLKELELSLNGDSYYKFLDMLTPLLEANTYDEIKNNINIRLPRLPNNSEQVAKNAKKNIGDYLDELCNKCLFESTDQMVEEYILTKDYVEIIIEIIKKLDKNIMEYKLKNDIFEFVDISKLAIDLLVKNQDIKEELKYYFNEIMIDEYQDTSDLQEEFISLIENNNVYMVGDIKQSIYRFRNANPSIFKQKYNQYNKKIGGVKIDLNKNFRSRKEVLDNINEFFDFIMDNDFGGANYQESHRMVFGNQAYIENGKTNQNYNLQILNYQVEKDSIYKKYKNDEIEAFIIANDILEKKKNKYQVFDKETGKLREIQYSDFVILMDRSNQFSLYKKIFEYMQIPLTIQRAENIMKQNEIYLIRNLLKLIECVENKEYNNRFRYSFTSIARSYLFSYSDQEIFHILNNNLYAETEIIKKVTKIVDLLPKLSLNKIMMTLIEEFQFYEKLITVGNIQMSISILEYFLELTANLEKLGYTYHEFIDYIEYIIENKKEIKISNSVVDMNSVQIMTIHESKGLEYPICYYSGLSSNFNMNDLKEKILFDNEYGMIIPCFKNGYRDIFSKELLKNKYMKEEISEKIRLFYVALTRCREQIIIISNMKEEENLNAVYQKEKYRSFLDILKSMNSMIQNYMIPVSLDNIKISEDYNILNTNKTFHNNFSRPLEVSEYQQKDTTIMEHFHFSKTISQLVDFKTKENLEFGTQIHELMEMIDFKNPDFSKLTFFEKKIITAFLNQDVLSNIKNANILKEYEFYTIDNGIEKHGMIDLILEYDTHIDIIDYKLKYIEDTLYLEQLRGYQNYIESRYQKKVNIYLYSIIDNQMKLLNEQRIA